MVDVIIVDSPRNILNKKYWKIISFVNNGLFLKSKNTVNG